MNREPGRLRWRLSELLAAKGLIVSPYDLWVQEGGYRHRNWDLARWGSNNARWRGNQTPDGREHHGAVHLSSWSTMSECVRSGIEIGEDTDGWHRVSVDHARQPGGAAGGTGADTKPGTARNAAGQRSKLLSERNASRWRNPDGSRMFPLATRDEGDEDFGRPAYAGSFDGGEEES